MTKSKGRKPRLQSRQYQTQSRAVRKRQAQDGRRTLLLRTWGLLALVVIVAAALVVYWQWQASGDEGKRPLADTPVFERNGHFSDPPEMSIESTHDYRARIVTEKGEIALDLFEVESPITVNNFVFLARQGFYDGVTFHRVIEGFVAQGGDPSGTGTGGPGYTFEDEIDSGLVFDRPGLLALANSGPNTNGSQFFITFAPTPHLNGLHTIFGEVTAGAEVLDRLTPRDPQDQSSAPGDVIEFIDIE